MRNPFQVQMTEAEGEEWKQKFRELAQPHVDEQVLAAGPFRRGGAAGQYALSKAGGGIPYAIGSLFQKKRAGGLPQRVFLAVTPTRLHAFRWKMKGRGYALQKEVAVWERAGLRVSTEQKMNLTMLTIESPAENEKATLAPGGVSDDPLTGAVISELQSGAPARPAQA